MKTGVEALLAFWVLTFLASPQTLDGAEKDTSICSALAQSAQLSNKEISLRGELGGSSLHGFTVFGTEDMQPCSQPLFKWLLTRGAARAIPLNYSASEPSVISEFEKIAQNLRTDRIRVRVNGILRAKWLFLSLCLNEDDCWGTGYFSKYPAVLELRSIQLLSEASRN
jgi:hypothetical protein